MMTDNATPPIEAPAPQTAARAPRRPLALILAIAALAAAGWQAYEGLGQRAAVAALQAGTSETDAALQARLDALQSRLAALEAPAAPAPEGDAADGREAALLLEVEQALTLAGQQLQLAGNVPVALLALQGADARLARADRPQYLPLRKALLKDIERLQALPQADLPGVALRLEQLAAGIDRLPLASRGRPAAEPEKAVAAAPDETWWGRAGRELWQELKGLVRIQRFDRDDAALLAPEQSFFLRENLKLRVLTARLALFARDQASFRNELKVADDWLGRFFLADDKTVQAAQATLRQALALELAGQLPTLADSEAALRKLGPAGEKR